MSVPAVAVAALVAQSVTVTLLPKNRLGSINIDVLIETRHIDTLEVTEHPVEQGSAITDHSFMRPFEVTLKCGWSNSSLNAIAGILAGVASFSFGSQPTVNDYVSGVYAKLQALQQGRQVFDIVTPLRTYQNMLVTELSAVRDQGTSQVLLATAVCRQVIIASATTTSLPPQSSQANPASTADTVNAGTSNLQSATPAPGGTITFDQWRPTS